MKNPAVGQANICNVTQLHGNWNGDKITQLLPVEVPLDQLPLEKRKFHNSPEVGVSSYLHVYRGWTNA